MNKGFKMFLENIAPKYIYLDDDYLDRIGTKEYSHITKRLKEYYNRWTEINSGYSYRLPVIDLGLPIREKKAILKKRLDDIMNTTKTPPSNSTGYIGLELEFYIPRHNQQKLRNELITTARHIHWGSDGSIHPCAERVEGYDPDIEYENIEIRVLFKIGRISVIDKVCKALHNNGALVNKTCGVHVHIDMRGYSDAVLSRKALNFNNILGPIRELTLLERRDSDFCQFSKNGIRNKIKYSAINIGHAYNKHKTFESRTHEGCLDPVELKNWCTFLYEFSRFKKVSKHNTANDMIKHCRFSPQTREYLKQRLKKCEG